MKKNKNFAVLLIIAIFFITSNSDAKYNSSIIGKVKLSQKDIPSGFTFGKVPGFARKVLKNNPWMLDTAAIKKLTQRIYPGGNYNKVKNIHMTIMADKKNPYGDDIVCYMIIYKNNTDASDEIKKITNFTGYNNDRAIVIVKENMAIFLHVDDVKNFHYINDLRTKLSARIDSI